MPEGTARSSGVPGLRCGSRRGTASARPRGAMPTPRPARSDAPLTRPEPRGGAAPTREAPASPGGLDTSWREGWGGTRPRACSTCDFFTVDTVFLRRLYASRHGDVAGRTTTSPARNSSPRSRDEGAWTRWGVVDPARRRTGLCDTPPRDGVHDLAPQVSRGALLQHPHHRGNLNNLLSSSS